MENFKQMYDQVYEMMVVAGVAVKTPELKYYNVGSQVVDENDTSVIGMGTHYLLHKPQLVFHFDETGRNTSQVKDGRLGGERFITPQGKKEYVKA